MNRCPEQTEWVLYAADELAASRRDVLQAHLESCAACREEMAAVSRGLASLAVLDREPALRPQAAATLRYRLADAAERRTARPWILAFFSRHRWAAAAALILWVTLAAAILAPVRPAAHNWLTDTQVSDEITAITAAVDMLERGDTALALENGVNHQAPPADKIDDEVEQFLQDLSNELGVEG
jgi:anti-sigma factor RsiW